MKVTPIAATQINWTDLLRLGKDVVGRSPSHSLDGARIKPGDIFSAIAALKELEVAGSDPRLSVANASAHLHHFSCSFMVEISESEISYLRNMEGLTVTFFEGESRRNKPQIHLLLITGTFAQWQMVIPQMLKSDKDVAYRELFTKIYDWFKRLNLKELFARYKEVSLKDGTLELE